MKRPVIYLAHPLGGDVPGNVRNALRWLRFAMETHPDWCVIAPWLAAVASGADDDEPNARVRGLLDAVEIVGRCDGILLCGGRISSGMQQELDAALARRLAVYDLSHHVTPPAQLSIASRLRHQFIATGDDDAFRQIQDRNCEVVLDYCRRCRQAEGELTRFCEAPV